MIGSKDQCFGVEIELTGVTRAEAAEALAAYFETTPQRSYDNYDSWYVPDREGKQWRIMSDGSIRAEWNDDGHYRRTTDPEYRVEMVTPKVTYDEMEKFQECVRRIRQAGGKVNDSCGMHVHVDASNHNRQSLKNLLSIMYSKEDLLAFEKEVLGFYISGHPLEEYEEQWRKGISKTTQDFQFDEELGFSRVSDGAAEIIGGIIASKTIKYTKNNKTMCFLTIEDIMGSVEVVVFPRDYERYHQYLEEENVVFVKGRVSEEDEASSKLICEKVIPFGQKKQELWIQYPDKETFLQGEKMLYDMLASSDGNDEVIVYCKAERAVKRLPSNRNVNIEPGLLSRLMNYFGESCVKVVEKPLKS